MQAYTKPLLKMIEERKIDPSFVITHRLGLDQAPNGYETFKHKQDECVKVVLKPCKEATCRSHDRSTPRCTA